MALHVVRRRVKDTSTNRADRAERVRRWRMLDGEGAHPEDAFIAAFLLRIAPHCRSGAEHALARVLAQDVLDQNPELAQRWGAIDVADWLRAALLLARRTAVERTRVGLLARELLRWLVATDRLAREDARAVCREVGSLATWNEPLAA